MHHKKSILLGSLAGLLLALIWMTTIQTVQAAPQAQLTPFPTPTPGADGRILYIVKANDTLWRISAITGVTLDELRALNKLGTDETIREGDVLLIGFAGPALVTVTAGPSPTPAPITPTPTYSPGSGNLCVILYDDLNGDMMRQEEEPALSNGAISVSNLTGSTSLTADSDAATDDCNIDPDYEQEIATGYVAFYDLPEGEYRISVAIPDGYNPTSALDKSITLNAGDQSYLTFGAQVKQEKALPTESIVEITPQDRSPLLAVIGVVIVLAGIALGVYAGLLARRP